MEPLREWQMEELLDLLEENPEVEQMTLTQLKALEQDLYRKASWKFDEGNRLENKASTIALYYALKKEGLEIERRSNEQSD